MCTTYLYLFLSLYALWILSVTALQLVTSLLVTGGCEKIQTLHQGQDRNEASEHVSQEQNLRRHQKAWESRPIF